MSSLPHGLTVRLARHEDAAAIDALRVEGYSAATWFRLEDARNVMLQSDPPGTQVLVAHATTADRALLATVAFSILRGHTGAATQLGCEVPAVLQIYPCSVAMRGSVHLDHRGHGFNHVLRYYAIEAARRGRLPQMLSVQAEAAPQGQVTRKLGYRYTKVDTTGMFTVRMPHGMFLVRLPRSAYDDALAGLRELLGPTLDNSTWEGERWTLDGAPALGPLGR